MSLIACPNGRPQESRSSPSAMGSTANRCPSRTVWLIVKRKPSRSTSVPACSLPVAIATLSPGAGSLPISLNSRTRSSVFKALSPLFLDFSSSDYPAYDRNATTTILRYEVGDLKESRVMLRRRLLPLGDLGEDAFAKDVGTLDFRVGAPKGRGST